MNRNGDFFTKLAPAAFQDLKSMEFPSSYGANVVLFAEKDPAEGIVIVLEGEVKLSINSTDGRRLSLSIARKGEILGLASVLSGSPHDVTAETLYPSKVAHISRRDFLNFLARHPEANQAVMEELSRYVTKGMRAVAYRWALCHGARKACPTFARLERGRPDNGMRHPLPVLDDP